MDISMQQLVDLGLPQPIAAAVQDACSSIKTLKGLKIPTPCWQVTIPVFIQQEPFLLEESSGVIRAGLLALYRQKSVQDALSRFLYTRGFAVHISKYHSLTVYDRSYESEFLGQLCCFRLNEDPDVDRVTQSLDLAEFLNRVREHPKCGVHGYASATAVAQGIRNAA